MVNNETINKQQQVFRQYGFDFKRNEKGYVASKTTEYMTYTFTFDLSRNSASNPQVIYKQQNIDCNDAFVNLTKMHRIKDYSKLTQFCIYPLEKIIRQIEWFQALCEDIMKTN